MWCCVSNPSGQAYFVLTVLYKISLGKVRMELDLVDSRLDLCCIPYLLDPRFGEVGHANGPALALLHEGLHGSPGLDQGDMNQVHPERLLVDGKSFSPVVDGLAIRHGPVDLWHHPVSVLTCEWRKYFYDPRRGRPGHSQGTSPYSPSANLAESHQLPSRHLRLCGEYSTVCSSTVSTSRACVSHPSSTSAPGPKGRAFLMGTTHEDVLPVDTRCFDPLTDFPLVVVHGGSIYVPVARLQSHLNRVLDLVRA